MGKVCRCLLKETDDREFWQQVNEYLDSLPAERKVDTAEYKRRLHFCMECDSLRNGFCSLCGCVAELRAAKRDMRCPDVPARW